MFTVKIKDVKNAEEDAIVVFNQPESEKDLKGIIVNRGRGGGIQHDLIRKNCLCFPVSFLKEALEENKTELNLPGGDWATIPYVRGKYNLPKETWEGYVSLDVELI